MEMRKEWNRKRKGEIKRETQIKGERKRRFLFFTLGLREMRKIIFW